MHTHTHAYSHQLTHPTSYKEDFTSVRISQCDHTCCALLGCLLKHSTTIYIPNSRFPTPPPLCGYDFDNVLHLRVDEYPRVYCRESFWVQLPTSKPCERPSIWGKPNMIRVCVCVCLCEYVWVYVNRLCY